MDIARQAAYRQDHGDSSSDSESVTSLQVDRKKRKPLMEKKRRARINASLEELKKLVLDAMKKDSARYSKLEKADILELTVRHLRESQQHQMNAAMLHDSSVANRYKAGFSECASEVSRYLSTIDGLSHDVRMRLMQHLSGCVHKVEVTSPKLPSSAAHMVPPSSVPSMAPVNLHHHHHQSHNGLQQPLQIQIPAASSVSSLPGSSFTAVRCSPEPGNLPPTPPSSAEHSFNGSFTFGSNVMATNQHYASVVPLQVHGQYEAPLAVSSPNMPLQSTENISKLPSQRHNSHRYSPYGVKAMPSLHKKSVSPPAIPMKDESMWRPW